MLYISGQWSDPWIVDEDGRVGVVFVGGGFHLTPLKLTIPFDEAEFVGIYFFLIKRRWRW